MVRFVVFFVVRNEIVKREAVVCRNEVDAGVRTAPRQLVEIGAAGETISELAEGLIGAAPIVTHRVAIFAVPLRPQRRKVSDLITALADIPRLGDQLHLTDDRVLLNDVEER